MTLTKQAQAYRDFIESLQWKGDPSTLRGFSGFFHYQMGWSTFAVNAPSREAAEKWAQSRHGWGSSGFVCGHTLEEKADGPFVGVGPVAVLNADGTLTGKVLS